MSNNNSNASNVVHNDPSDSLNICNQRISSEEDPLYYQCEEGCTEYCAYNNINGLVGDEIDQESLLKEVNIIKKELISLCVNTDYNNYHKNKYKEKLNVIIARLLMSVAALAIACSGLALCVFKQNKSIRNLNTAVIMLQEEIYADILRGIPTDDNGTISGDKLNELLNSLSY